MLAMIILIVLIITDVIIIKYWVGEWGIELRNGSHKEFDREGRNQSFVVFFFFNMMLGKFYFKKEP